MHKAYTGKVHIEQYDQRHFGGRTGALLFNKECETIDSFLNPSSGLLLDVPCGTGIYSSRFRQIGYEVIALDNSLPMLDLTVKRDAELIKIQSDVFKIPFQNSSIDNILTIRLFQHFKRSMVLQVLNELTRVLKPNGRLIFDTFRWSPKQMPVLQHLVKGEMYVFSHHDVLSMINDVGLEKLDSRSLHLYSPIWQRKLPYWIFVGLQNLEKILPESWLLRTFWSCTKNHA